MAIVKDGGHTPPCVIPLENAWHWSETLGPNPDILAARMLLVLGVNPSEDNRHKLIDLVNSRLHDLVVMPPRPADAEEHAAPLADFTIKNDISGTTEVSL
jgi:hypothetical protein